MRISDWSSDVCSSDLAERKFFPGYVLAKLTMTDDVYHLVKNTPKVTGFLGSMGKPQAISEAEAARILNSKEEAAARPKTEIRVDYEIGDQVKVLDRSEEHTSELQSLMRISYAVFCLKKKK